MYVVPNLSVKVCEGARKACASRIRRMIFCSELSVAGRSTFPSMTPLRLIVPANAVSPGNFGTGTDSPVRFDSSHSERPLVIVMSTGICPPATTRTVMPGSRSSTGTSLSLPLAMTSAVLGAPRKSAPISRRVRPMA